MTLRARCLCGVLPCLAVALAGCGSGGAGAVSSSSPAAGTLNVFPQNSTVVVGVNRVGIALLDARKQPILNAHASLDVVDGGRVVETRRLDFIGSVYVNKPVYIGLARFDHTGDYQWVVHATLSDGRSDSGLAHVTATNKSPELPVGHSLSEVRSDLRQQIASDPGVKLSDIDSGVPPDNYHDTTIAQGLATHKPMVLYFGEPGRCPTQTCGPTLQVLEQILPPYREKLVVEHIEIHMPASSEALNPIYLAFGLTSEPWLYFVNAGGVVADRFEGFVTPDQLRQAVDGTLAGRVPAVDLTLG